MEEVSTRSLLGRPTCRGLYASELPGSPAAASSHQHPAHSVPRCGGRPGLLRCPPLCAFSYIASALVPSLGPVGQSTAPPSTLAFRGQEPAECSGRAPSGSLKLVVPSASAGCNLLLGAVREAGSQMPAAQAAGPDCHGWGWSGPISLRALWFAVRVRTTGDRCDDAHGSREPERPISGPSPRYDAKAEINR